MTPELWLRVKEVYSEALELTPAERAAFVEQACVGETEVRAEVLALLAVPENESAVIDKPMLGGAVARLGAKIPEPAPPLAPGEIVGGRFRILRRVGAGGMGEVYEAEDLSLGERVALKTILPEIAGDETAIARFRRELQLARQVTHPNVCRVFDFVQLTREDGRPPVDALTMEFLEGEPLSDCLRREGPLPPAKAEAILEQMVAGLAAAHRAGVVHRDFKSSNVFLSSDRQNGLRVAITDFGLARSYSGESVTAHGASAWGMGTPAYMAPEQVEGKHTGPAADQYALGVAMYEMLTGSMPYPGDSPLQVAVRRIKEPPRPPRLVNPGIPAGWEAAILRCLEYDPRDRFPALEQVLDTVRSGSRSRWLTAALRRRWRKPLALAGAAAALVAATVWVSGALRRVEPLPPGVSRWYQEGTNAAVNGSWFRARQAFEAALQGKPDFAEARARLADALTELDQYDEARAEILRATDAPKRSRAEERFVAATRGLILRDLPKVCEIFAGLANGAQGGPGRAQALLDFARCQDKADQTAAAQETYKKVLATDASNPGALIALAGIEDRQGHAVEALTLLDQAQSSFDRLQNQEGLAELDLRRAAVLEHASRLAEASQAAGRAVRAARGFQNQHLALRGQLRQAALAVSLGDKAAGKRLASAAVEEARTARLENTIAAGWIDLGSTFFSQRQYEDAELLFKQGLEAARKTGARRLVAQAQVELGRVYGQLAGRTKDGYPLLASAETFFTGARMQREALWSRYARAGLLFIDDEKQAAGLYRQIIPAARELGESRLEATSIGNLAKLAELAGDYPGAVAQYREAVAVSRKAGLATEMLHTVRLAQNLSHAGQYGEAQTLLQDVLAQTRLKDDSARLLAWRALANTQGSQLQFEQADRTLEQAMQFARERNQTTDELGMRVSRCVYAAEAGWTAKAIERCTPIEAPLAELRSHAQWSDVVTALAIAALDAGQSARAIDRALEGRRIALEGKQERNAWYALLIEADARRRQGDRAGFDAASAQARKEMETLTARWGKPTAERYLARPGIARRWAKVLQ